MRRVHETHLAQPFALRYWGVVGVVLGVPAVVTVAAAATAGESLLGAVMLPGLVIVGVVAFLAWRWSAHRIEVTDETVIERRHPLIWYKRRRGLDEITEVTWCPPERRGLEHGESSLLLRCTRPERNLVVAPANAEQFLDDLAAVEPGLQRYRGKVVRRADAGLPSDRADG